MAAKKTSKKASKKAAGRTTAKKPASRAQGSKPGKKQGNEKAATKRASSKKAPTQKKASSSRPAAAKIANEKASPSKRANKKAASKKAASKKATSKKATSNESASSKKPTQRAAGSGAASTKKKASKSGRSTTGRATTGRTTTGRVSTGRVSTTKSQAAAEVAARVLAGEDDKTVSDLGDDLISGKKSVAAQAARVLEEIVQQKPEAVVPIIDRFVKALAGPDKRPAQAAANALPVMSRLAPARVARHLPRLKESFDGATDPGKDGLVRTFAGLCTASVAYQKRLEDVLNKALREADAKTLITWTEVVLPALKGEPHARARATVEGRLGRIPKVHAQKIADFLGIKLRLRYR